MCFIKTMIFRCTEFAFNLLVVLCWSLGRFRVRNPCVRPLEEERVGPISLDLIGTVMRSKANSIQSFSLLGVCFGMEWNLKNPLQWDWENLALFTVKESEISKSTEQSVLRAEREVISNGSVYSPDSGTCSGSELGNGSSRNSISPSVGSLSKVGNKISEVNLEPVKGFLENQIKNNEAVHGKDPRTSPVMVGYVGTEEPPIGLKLGKRTYFENMGSVNIKTSSSVSTMPSATSVKRSKASQLVIQHSHCQVEGCNIDLIGAKYYHRKHKVCESHSKSPRVIVAGHECRFCQQCSRFHDLSEFDQKKRSCRRRLSDHNARRRKPQPETISFNSSMLSSPFSDGRQQMNFSLNLARVNHVRPASSFWNDSYGFNISMAKGSWLKPTKVDVDGQSQLPVTDFSNILIASRDDFDRLMPFKLPITEVLNQGQEASVSASDLNGAGDIQRALSLLSNDSWGPSSTAQSNMIQFAGTNLTTASQPPVQVVKSTHECWEDVHSLAEQALTFNLHGSGSHVQEFHLGKATYESPSFEASQVFPKSDSHFLEFKT